MSNKKINPNEVVFEADGQGYCFVAGKFQMRLTDGEPDDGGMLVELTCEEAAKQPAILAHLSSIKSGVIQAVELEDVTLTVPQIKALLDEAGVKYAPSDKKAVLEALLNDLNKEE